MKPKIKESADFKAGIKKMIDKGEHVDYFKELLRHFDYYQKCFAHIFNPLAAKIDTRYLVYTFDVAYSGRGGGSEDIVASREIEIAGQQTFEDLARHIILSMGWVNDHMHGFDLTGKPLLPDPLYIGSALTMYADGWEDEPHPTFKTYQVRIVEVDFEKQPVFDFMFDYGDGHSFVISYKTHGKMSRSDTTKDFPRLIDSRGIAPEQYPPLT